MVNKIYRTHLIIPLLIFLPAIVLAQSGVIPCAGLDCTLCSFFKLFHNIFNLAITILAPAVATFGIAYGGYLILLGGSNPGNLSKGKDALKNTFIGLAIVYGSYAIASTLIWFLAEGVVGGSGVKYGFENGRFTFSCSADSSQLSDLDADNFTIELSEPMQVIKDVKTEGRFTVAETEEGVATVNGINRNIDDHLSDAFAMAEEQGGGFGLIVTSGFRDIADQNRLVTKNCTAGATSPKQCSPETCIPNMSLNPEGSNCRHTTGNAVDVVATKDGEQCKTIACQNVVIRIMKKNGFCRLSSETWHFELKSTLDETDPAREASSFDCAGTKGSSSIERTW